MVDIRARVDESYETDVEDRSEDATDIELE